MKYIGGLLKSAFCLITCVGVLFYSNSAIAAEKIVFKYGIFHASVPVSELTTLAETGEASLRLNFFLSQAHQDPQTLRNTLIKEVTVSSILLDRALNNPIGELLLDQISQTIHTPSN